MPHSWPAVTSRASSLKRLSCESLPSWMTTLSRMRRTLAPRSTMPSVTRQPATLPTFETLNTSRMIALPSMVSRRVGANLAAVALGRPGRFLVGAQVEADDGGARGFRQRHVRLGDAADARIEDARHDLRRAELVERADDRLDRALHVALDDEREFLAARRLELMHHVLERAAHLRGARRRLLALLARAIVADLAGARLVLDDREAVARLGGAVEAEHLDRHRRAGELDRIAGIRHERAHAPPFGAGNHDVAHAHRAP